MDDFSFSHAPASRCLLTVHAHPDDEASKGAGTCRKYHELGVRTVLVCCTAGELGDIANPAMDLPGVREDLARVRSDELAKSVAAIGFDVVEMLGYRDSGMAGSPGNDDPRSFHRAPIEEAVGRLVRIIRRERPQVILTYGDDQQGYPHPDHLRVHDVSVLAFDAAGQPDAYPEAGPAWQPAKMYYSAWSRARFLAMHTRFGELGLASPYDDRWLSRPSHDYRITTRIEVEQYYDTRVDALLAHATQIDPDSPFWFGLPHDEARTVHPYDEFVLARSMVGSLPDPSPEGADAVIVEDDLFVGIEVLVD